MLDFGKRPVFVFASGLLCACYVWGALATSFESLLWSNIVAAFAGSSTEALGAAIVNVSTSSCCLYIQGWKRRSDSDVVPVLGTPGDVQHPKDGSLEWVSCIWHRDLVFGTHEGVHAVSFNKQLRLCLGSVLSPRAGYQDRYLHVSTSRSGWCCSARGTD